MMTSAADGHATDPAKQENAQAGGERAAWMRVLALSQPEALASAYAALGPLPERRWLRTPQTGMAMVRARAGGTGEPFNLGEMTVTRCAVTLPDEVVGIAYVQGRSATHAEQSAVLDGLLQMPQWHAKVQAGVIAPLAQAHRAAATEKSKVAAQTKVEFFTLVRGEN
jgi:alpha-D-ribose 1-methylphosphonate 5-triphosphate synthase subunit PhnG